MRYNANGSLDTSFDANGKQATSFGGLDQAEGVAIQADGKIVAAGSTGAGFDGTYDVALARYTPSGALDDPFGKHGDGKVKTALGSGNHDHAEAVAIQPGDGMIVAAGSSAHAFLRGKFALARYHAVAGSGNPAP